MTLADELEAKDAEIVRLREALKACRKAVSSTANEPRRTVRDIADVALEIHDRRIAALRASEPAEQVVDLDKNAFDELVRAAGESAWIPPEYYMQDWVSDTVDFLRTGKGIEPAEPVAGEVCWLIERDDMPGGTRYFAKNEKGHDWTIDPNKAERFDDEELAILCCQGGNKGLLRVREHKWVEPSDPVQVTPTGKAYTADEIDFVQRLLAVFGEGGGTIDLMKDHEILIREYRRSIAQGRALERAEVVAWLRSNAPCCEYPDDAIQSQIADAIASGAHKGGSDA